MKRFLTSLSFQLFGFLALGVLITLFIFYVSYSYNIHSREFLRYAKKQTTLLDKLKEMRYHFGFARKEEKNWFLFQNPSYLESRKKSLVRSQNLLIDLQKMVTNPEMVENLESLESHLLHYTALGTNLKEVKTIRQVEAFTLKVRQIDEDMISQVSEVNNQLLTELNQRRDSLLQSSQATFSRFIIILTAGLAFYIGIGSLWLRSFRRRLKQLVHATQKMATGDYSPQLDGSGKDELGQLASYFNEMAQKILQREEKINQITSELIQANNLLKKEHPISLSIDRKRSTF